MSEASLYSLIYRTRRFGVARGWYGSGGKWYSDIHKGDDYARTRGHDPVPAFAGGTVVARGYSNVYGYYLHVRPYSGRLDRYHMLEGPSPAAVGQVVSTGTIIGKTGASAANASGNHVHVQVELNGVPVDPRPYIERFLSGSPADTSSSPSPIKDWFDMATLEELRGIVRTEVTSLMDDEVRVLDAIRREARGWRLFRNTNAAPGSDAEFVAINYNLPPGDHRQVIWLSAREATSLRGNYLMLADTVENAQRLDSIGIATAIRLADGTDQVYSA